MFRKIDHFEIVPSDAEATIRFYTDVLGFSIKSRTEVKMPPMQEVIFLELGGTTLEIIAADGARRETEDPWRVGYRALALEVDDMAETVGYLKAKGIAITHEPVDLGASWRGEITDPDGLVIELRQWKKRGIAPIQSGA
jgi:glyoxylase I family protein